MIPTNRRRKLFEPSAMVRAIARTNRSMMQVNHLMRHISKQAYQITAPFLIHTNAMRSIWQQRIVGAAIVEPHEMKFNFIRGRKFPTAKRRCRSKKLIRCFEHRERQAHCGPRLTNSRDRTITRLTWPVKSHQNCIQQRSRGRRQAFLCSPVCPMPKSLRVLAATRPRLMTLHK